MFIEKKENKENGKDLAPKLPYHLSQQPQQFPTTAMIESERAQRCWGFLNMCEVFV
jgi:hypothetical protein